MWKLGLKFGVLLAVIIIILEVLNPIFANEHFFAETISDYKKETSIHLVFFGNSHSHFTYDPRIFEKELGLSTFNISSPGQRLISTQAMIDMFLKTHKPKLAIVDIFSLSLEEPDNEKYRNFQSQALDYIPISFKKAEIVQKTYNWEEYIQGLFTTIRFHYKWHTIELPKKKFQFPSKQDYYKGFASYTTILEPKAWQDAEEVYTKQKKFIEQLSEREKLRIDAVIDQFEKSDVEVLFISAPDYAQGIGVTYTSYIAAIKEYVESKNKSFLDLGTKWDEIGLVKKDFRDFNHLNTNGAIKTSIFLSDYLKKYKDASSIDLFTNRYALIDGDVPPIYSTELPDSISQQLGGIKSIALYKKNKHLYEFLFFTDTDTVGKNKMRLNYKHNQTDLDDFKSYNLLTKNGIVYNYVEFDNNNLITYKDKSFFYFSFYCPFSELISVTLHGGKNRNFKIIEEDLISLE